ncbi:MAG: M23 family metallopeptidase [Candidatus Aminicenantes bacterium]|nr:MAG: M23 family metallopeptidase [Candidatus Aminicenantes bacterium]
MRKRFKHRFYFALLVSLLLFSQCQKEIVPEPFKPSNSHEAYVQSLRSAGLAHTAIARDWILASENSMKNPVDMEPPFEETFYVDHAAAFAVAYHFSVIKGQRVEIDVAFDGQKRCRLFMDLFRVRGLTYEDWRLVASANNNEKHLEFEPKQDSEYVLRLQPELLRGGRFTVTIRNMASLGFPVLGYDSRAIGSGFGAPRDGGRRRHHGVDIFTKRHTPVIAPSKAYVRRVSESDIGGLNIWLHDAKRDLHLYFAHLQTQEVEQSTYVVPGQRIGTVGNTGNARRTPPHLHFGIYARGEGPVDPVNFIKKIDSTPKDITADLNVLGHWARSKQSMVSLKASTASRALEIVRLNPHSAMKIQAAVGDTYRVLLPDGLSGYVPSRDVESIIESLATQQAGLIHEVREAPMEQAVVVEKINGGEEYAVLGHYERYMLVRTEKENVGWLMIPTEPGSSRLPE